MKTRLISSLPVKSHRVWFCIRTLLLAGLVLTLVQSQAKAAENYTDKLTHTRLFMQPLIWVGATPPAAAESQALWEAFGVGRYKNIGEAVSGLEAFVKAHSDSPWTPSLRGNLADYYKQNGYFTAALDNWEAAWDATRQMTDQRGSLVADYALVHWLQLLASLGRTDTMQQLFDETQNRRISTPLFGLYQQSQKACMIMLNHPEIAYRCGTYALDAVAQVLTGTNYFRQIWQQPSPETGFSMASLVVFAEANHLGMTAVERPGGDELVVPSVVHWKQNHYAAIVARKGDLYKVVDPTFRMSRWLKADAINTECSGQFLVSTKQVPADWRTLSQLETAGIFGKGYPPNWVSPPCPPSDGCPACMPPPPGPPPPGSGPPPGGGCSLCSQNGPSAQSVGGMPTWTVMEPWCDLWIKDEPLAYQPAKGPRISFQLFYSSEGIDYWPLNQPGENDQTIFGLGWNWNCSWLSFIVPGDWDGGSDDSEVVFSPGGGTRFYTNFDGTVPEFSTNTRLLMETNHAGDTIGYRVLYPSGAEDVYEQTNYTVYGYDTVFFMSQQVNPSGQATTFTYTNNADGGILLQYVIDGAGKTNVLSYTNVANTNGVAAYNVISKITDPYGHTVNFSYNHAPIPGLDLPGEGMLTNVTDVGGISTGFSYNTNYDEWTVPVQMTTPYGTTTFDQTYTFGYAPIYPAMIVTEPNGSHQMFAFVGGDAYLSPNYSLAIPETYTDPRYVPTNRPADNPSGSNTLDNPDWNGLGTNGDNGGDYMQWANSFYWGREQFANLSTNFLATGPNWDFTQMTTNDFLVARMRHWNQLPGEYFQGNNLSMEREPSPDIGITPGEMTWYDYAGKPYFNMQGSSDTPILTIKVLPNGSEWYQINQLDQWSNATNVINTYSVNGVTLLRTNRYVYAANGQDLLLSVGPDGITNNAYGYDNNHNVLFMTNALGEVTSYLYNTYEQLVSIRQPDGLVTTNIYNSNNFLAQQIALGFSTNSYTYTNELVYTHTDERGLTVTNTWDAMQRLTNVAYPDGTSISYSYNILDLAQVTDRMGFKTSYGYNSIRQKIAETNALGYATYYDYCQCGALSQIIDALTNVTTFTHDNQGNLTQVAYPDEYTVDNTYNLIHQLVTQSDSSGMNLTNYFNNQGLLVASSNNVGRVQNLAYDIDDRITNRVDANGVSVNMTYDNLRRPLTRSYPDGGVEKYGYTPNIPGLTAYTNQIGNIVLYGYDPMNRKTNEVYVGATTNSFAYNAASDLLTLTDGNTHTTTWGYDIYGRVTNKLDAASNLILTYKYDPDDRLTNRWSAAKTNTVYKYDAVGNLTNVVYPVSPAISLSYDALNRLTGMVDAVGATAYSYDQVGQLLSAGGLWPDDTVNYSYANRLRMMMSVQAPNASSWTQSYGYDSARRLTSVASPVGAFGYTYDPVRLQRVDVLTMPGDGYMTNTYDSVARQTLTELVNARGTNLDSYAYGYNQANQRTNVVRTTGDYVNYSYDNEGELTSAIGKAAGGVTNRWQEQFGYAYDAGGNLSERTNNALMQRFNVNSLNELTTVTNGGRLTVAGSTTSPATNVTVNTSNAVLYADITFASTNQPWANGNNTYAAIALDAYGRRSTNTLTVSLSGTNNYSYDLNGNLLSDGTRNFGYDDENELISVWQADAWSNNFVYDGKMRRRIERDYSWNGSSFIETNEVHFVYDGNVVVQERNASNLPTVTYTRGNDLSGILQGAGGIGGLLARTSNSQFITSQPFASALYHADGNGNVTCLMYTNGLLAAKYLYDPFGNTLAQYGTLASANSYRFSSKEWNANSGLYCYLYRFYDSNLQRWPNRDPLADEGFQLLSQMVPRPPSKRVQLALYEFTGNDPLIGIDPFGLDFIYWPPQDPGGGCNGDEVKECQATCATQGLVLKKCILETWTTVTIYENGPLYRHIERTTWRRPVCACINPRQCPPPNTGSNINSPPPPFPPPFWN